MDVFSSTTHIHSGPYLVPEGCLELDLPSLPNCEDVRASGHTWRRLQREPRKYAPGGLPHIDSCWWPWDTLSQSRQLSAYSQPRIVSTHLPRKSKWYPSRTTHSVPRVLVLPDAVCLLSLFPSSPRILDIFRSPLHQAHYPAKLDLGSTTLLSYFLSAPRSPSVLQLPCYLISVHCARLLKWLLCRLQVIALILHIFQHLAGWAGMEIDFAIHGSFFNPFVIIQLSNQGVGGGNQIHSHSVLRLCISNHSSGFLSFPQVPVPFET